MEREKVVKVTKRAILNNFKFKFHDVLKFAFIFSWIKKNVFFFSKTSSTVPITILMLKSISGHGKGKGGKGNQKSVDVNNKWVCYGS